MKIQQYNSLQKTNFIIKIETTHIYKNRPPKINTKNKSLFKAQITYNSIRQSIYNKDHSVKMSESKNYSEIDFDIEYFKNK